MESYLEEKLRQETSAFYSNYGDEIQDNINDGRDEDDETEVTEENVYECACGIDYDSMPHIQWQIGRIAQLKDLIHQVRTDNPTGAKLDIKAMYINRWKDRLDRAIDNLEKNTPQTTKRAIEALESLSTDLLLAK